MPMCSDETTKDASFDHEGAGILFHDMGKLKLAQLLILYTCMPICFLLLKMGVYIYHVMVHRHHRRHHCNYW